MRPVSGSPSTRTLPLDGASSPAAMLSSVDLPQPLGPTIADERAGGDGERDVVERAIAAAVRRGEIARDAIELEGDHRWPDRSDGSALGRVGRVGRAGSGRGRNRVPQLAQKTLSDVRDFVGGRAFAVRAVAAFRQHRNVTRRSSVAAQRLAHRVELARLGARIARAVNHQRRQAEVAEPSAVQIGGRRRTLVRDPQPGVAVGPNEIAPAVAVLAGQHRGDPLPKPVRVAHHRLEELARRRLAAARNARLRRSDRSAARARPAPSAARSRRRRCVPRPRDDRDRARRSPRMSRRRRDGESRSPAARCAPSRRIRCDRGRPVDGSRRAPRSADRTDRSRSPSRREESRSAVRRRRRDSARGPATSPGARADEGSSMNGTNDSNAYAKVSRIKL